MRERTVVLEPKDFFHEEAEEPLEIMVTEAGSITARLYALLRKALPALENPESVPDSYRETLTDNIRRELEGVGEEGDTWSWFDTEA